MPSSTSDDFVTSLFLVFTVMDVLVHANPKIISHEGSLTTIIKHRIRFNNTIKEFMSNKYRYYFFSIAGTNFARQWSGQSARSGKLRYRYYTHTHNIRFSVSCCTINIYFWFFWDVTVWLRKVTFLCFITMQMLGVFSYKFCISFCSSFENVGSLTKGFFMCKTGKIW